MRDRLIELLKKEQEARCKYTREKIQEMLQGNLRECLRTGFEFSADYLLENGVIVPPCKVGQVLFVIESGRIIESKVKEYKYSSNSQNGVHWHIIFEELFAMSEAHIGKTVFYTRKEAMQALKGGEG